MIFTPFSQIIGQERAIQFLKRVIEKGKIPHAYLFAGIPGIGKSTTAMALTRAVNCHSALSEEGCGHCKSCHQIKSGNFPDLVSIRPDGQNVKIEQIRDLNRTLSLKPFSGRFRVCIIHHAETMTDEAANSLLKTLEEPPQNNIMILKVSEPLALLPTILSRCQKVLFQPISIQAIRDWLVDKKEMKKEQALVLANISEGSLGKAIHLYESDYLEKRQDYLSKLFQLPGLSQEKALEMALEFTGKTKKRALRASETGDVTLFDLLGVWKTWYRDLLLMKVKCPADLLINIDFFHELKISPKGIKIDDLINSFMIVDQAQRELQRSRNLDLMMENTLLALKNLNHGFS